MYQSVRRALETLAWLSAAEAEYRRLQKFAVFWMPSLTQSKLWRARAVAIGQTRVGSVVRRNAELTDIEVAHDNVMHQRSLAPGELLCPTTVQPRTGATARDDNARGRKLIARGIDIMIDKEHGNAKGIKKIAQKN
jgi:hypothetical protein